MLIAKRVLLLILLVITGCRDFALDSNNHVESQSFYGEWLAIGNGRTLLLIVEYSTATLIFQDFEATHIAQSATFVSSYPDLYITFPDMENTAVNLTYRNGYLVGVAQIYNTNYDIQLRFVEHRAIPTQSIKICKIEETCENDTYIAPLN